MDGTDVLNAVKELFQNVAEGIALVKQGRAMQKLHRDSYVAVLRTVLRGPDLAADLEQNSLR